MVKNTEFIDVFPAMPGMEGKPRPELFVPDGVHSSKAGYAVWTGVIGKSLP